MRKYSSVVMLIIVLLLLGGSTDFWADGPLGNSANQQSNEKKFEDEKKSHNEEADGHPSDPQASLALNYFGQSDDSTVYVNAAVDDMREGAPDFRFTHGDSNVIQTTNIERTPTDYYAYGIRMDTSKLIPQSEWQPQVSLPDTEPLVMYGAKEAMIK